MERTDAEILDRIETLSKEDVFGWLTVDLIARLPFDAAKPYLKPEVSPEDWSQSPRDRESLMKEMLDYMPFAWQKANDCRGLSAGRSLSHYQSWLWLAGEDLGDITKYEHYGKDHLVRICKAFGWDHEQWDDGVRTNGDD